MSFSLRPTELPNALNFLFRTLFGFYLIARKTLGSALDGDVNLKIGIMMCSMCFAGVFGSFIVGLLIDRFKRAKIIGIIVLSIGKIRLSQNDWLINL